LEAAAAAERRSATGSKRLRKTLFKTRCSKHDVQNDRRKTTSAK
jgi:hypothetical protein